MPPYSTPIFILGIHPIHPPATRIKARERPGWLSQAATDKDCGSCNRVCVCGLGHWILIICALNHNNFRLAVALSYSCGGVWYH
jgi:hypothetical protein